MTWNSHTLNRVIDECRPLGTPISVGIELAPKMSHEDGIAATNAALINLEQRIIALERQSA